MPRSLQHPAYVFLLVLTNQKCLIFLLVSWHLLQFFLCPTVSTSILTRCGSIYVIRERKSSQNHSAHRELNQTYFVAKLSHMSLTRNFLLADDVFECANSHTSMPKPKHLNPCLPRAIAETLEPQQSYQVFLTRRSRNRFRAPQVRNTGSMHGCETN